jgi:hypothetical protein
MQRTFAFAFSLTCLLAACGSSDDPAADAGPDASDQSPDAGPAACAKFDDPVATLSAYPATHAGSLSGETAALEVAQGVCDVELMYYTQEGPDQVIALTGLVAGTRYGVRLIAPGEDLSFYVATGCTESAGGPAEGQCLLFVDEAVGPREYGDFVAPDGGEAFVVVDTYFEDLAASGAYSLEVYETECAAATPCPDAGAPHCLEGTCVECLTSFDCADADAPACDQTTHACTYYDECVDDDEAENGDDGPAGATVLAPTAEAPAVVEAAICSQPAEELDYFRFDAAEGDRLFLVLDWDDDAVDLDLYLLDADGAFLASSLYDRPEGIDTGALSAGTYYVVVHQYEPAATTAVTPYTLTARFPECDTSFDCEDPAFPVCSLGACSPGPSECLDDDAAENGDDGPAGATDVTPEADGAPTVTAAKICNVPASEVDFFKVTVDDGDSLVATLAWEEDGADLDLTAFTATGETLGITFWAEPEVITLTYLPAGTYYLRVQRFAQQAIPEAMDYTLTVARTSGGCTSAADCAAEHTTQFFRGSCDTDTGVCDFIRGDGALELGDRCDSPGDCASGRCSYLLFQSDAHHSVCTVPCSSDATCTDALGAGYACTTPFQQNICNPQCTTDTDCGANINNSNIDDGLPWKYLSCDVGTGVCNL